MNELPHVAIDVPSELSPIEALGVFASEPNSFILSSGLNTGSGWQYSFAGTRPFLVFRSKGKETEVTTDSLKKKIVGNPFDILKEILAKYKDASASPFPLFPGVAVGYFGYGLSSHIEELPITAVDDLALPDCYLCFYDTIITFDQLNRKIQLYSSRLSGGETISSEEVGEKLHQAKIRERNIHTFSKKESPSIISNFQKEDYLQAIVRAKDYIDRSDIYQINLSQRLMMKAGIPPFELYRRLCILNPSPFASFLNFEGISVVGSSPERFLRLRNREVETSPMKGTRPRGESAREDKKLEKELLSSEKEKAELIMIVDLERNDLGRVCEYGSVRVKESRNIEKYATVFQTTATIIGTLREDKDAIDLLRASFPGGSVTGVPKVRAMELIDELEPTQRSVYTGAIGYISFTGEIDLNIAIRTFLIKNERAYFQVGGGIVADSEPEAEYEETLTKARALIQVLTEVTEAQRHKGTKKPKL
ncbi:aminodeoxychorismate synthase component I [candidate division NPL-UPA2 bacterium Unc8]|uniref:Anthranilate synthase component 1 n=1 Tax=candidate division NPL-UPA2 bacterium Unc8 TaxID=1980939 RepID=A0A399FX34_UNCN2|nr:Anthranilate synthase component 1 [Bacillota bacterium]RII00046.1 MAG: aminodeoxychorismate synthase component I [candidate division NPL-UPA2 bacterium Unc8]